MSKPKPSACQGCPLYRAQQNSHFGFITPEGVGESGVHIMGEAGGKHEHLDGFPFRPWAQAGSVLERVFTRVRKDRDLHVISNTVNCQPPRDFLIGAPWEQEAIKHCEAHRKENLTNSQPRVILALGNTPLRTLTNFGVGKKGTISYVRGYTLPSVDYFIHPETGKVMHQDQFTDPQELIHAHPVPVISSFHPSYLKRGATQYYPTLMMDLMNAHILSENILNNGPHRFIGPNDMDGYETAETTARLERLYNDLLANPHLLLTYDIETDRSLTMMEDEIFSQADEDDDILGTEIPEEIDPQGGVIESIQFSTAIGTGLFVPWVAEFIPLIKKILATPNPKANFNGYLFDDPVILSSGLGMKIHGEIHDLMWAWHHNQPDLDANLQFVSSFYGFPFPWKHFSSSAPEMYGCADVDAPQRIYARLLDQLKNQGLYDGYERHVIKLRKALHGAEIRGVPMNKGRLDKMVTETEQERVAVYDHLQTAIPDQLKPIHPKPSKTSTGGYKNWPKQVVSVFPELKEDPDAWKDPDSLVARLNSDPRTKDPLIPSDQKKRTGHWEWDRFEETDKKTGESFTAPRLFIRRPFLPGSSQHIIEAIKHFKHKVPVDFKTGRQTTAKKEVERLRDKHRESNPEAAAVYSAILDHRKFEKIISTYGKGWQPNPKTGAVHTQFTYRPATGQTSSRKPNIQNGPKHDKIAKTFRAAIEAKPGHRLIEIDYSAFHVLTTGFEAKDPLYMGLARIDPHSFVASHMKSTSCDPIDPTLSYDEIAERTAWVKNNFKHVRNKQAKPGILGYGFGLGVNNFFQQNYEHFESKREVEDLFKLLDDLFPVTAKWRDDVRKEAHRLGYLKTLHGSIRRFGEVYVMDPRRGHLVPGNDSEKAIAFRPANDAFGHIKDVIIWLEEQGYNEKFGFINTVHDSLWFHCWHAHVDEAIDVVTKAMIKNSEILVNEVAPEGLWCGIEGEVGMSMNSLETVIKTDHNKEIIYT